MTSVLVCDDSPLAREALRRAVATVPGVERVTTAANGEEVLRRWGADRSDLILMDVRMPGLGGVETVRRLLSADPGARIIMLTVAEDLDGVALAVAAGARGYLHKDASRAELRATVTQALADPTWRLAPGSADSSRRTVSTPPSPGMRTSIRIRSERSAPQRRRTSSPLAAVVTRSTPGTVATARRSASRASGESSQTRTDVMAVLRS